jgi:hypothetical protein
MLKFGVVCSRCDEEAHPLCHAENFGRIGIPRRIVAEIDHRGTDETSGLYGRQLWLSILQLP